MKTAIVTGGTGNIGSSLVEKLFDRGFKIYQIDRQDDIFDVTTPVDIIYHCADVGPSGKNRADSFLDNLDITNKILHYWKTIQSTATFIGMDSIWAYPHGHIFSNYSESEYWLGAMTDFQEHYGIIKKVLLAGIKAHKHQYNMKGSMLALGNVFGPKSTGNIVNFLIREMQNESPVIKIEYCQKNFTYVEDQVEGIISASECDVDHLNIVPLERSIKEVVFFLTRLLNYKGIVEYIPNTRSRVLCGYMANTLGIWENIKLHSLEEGLKKTIAGLKIN